MESCLRIAKFLIIQIGGKRLLKAKIERSFGVSKYDYENFFSQIRTLLGWNQCAVIEITDDKPRLGESTREVSWDAFVTLVERHSDLSVASIAKSLRVLNEVVQEPK